MKKIDRQGIAETIAELVWIMEKATPEDTIEFDGRPRNKYDFAQALRRMLDKYLPHG